MIKKKKMVCFIKENRKKLTLLTMLVICICTYVAADNLRSQEVDNNKIPIHDGDVLVTSDDVTELEDSDAYFKELRATLDMDRNKLLSMMEEKEKAKLLEYMEQEKTIETLIMNKGLHESFVVITDTGVNVTVNTKELDQNTVTKICEIIMRQTGRKASEIVVQDAS